MGRKFPLLRLESLPANIGCGDDANGAVNVGGPNPQTGGPKKQAFPKKSHWELKKNTQFEVFRFFLVPGKCIVHQFVPIFLKGNRGLGVFGGSNLIATLGILEF